MSATPQAWKTGDFGWWFDWRDGWQLNRLQLYKLGWWRFTEWNDNPSAGLHASEWYAPIVNLGNCTIQACGSGMLHLLAPVLGQNVYPVFRDLSTYRQQMARFLTGLWVDPLEGFTTETPVYLKPCLICGVRWPAKPWVKTISFGANNGYTLCWQCAANQLGGRLR